MAGPVRRGKIGSRSLNTLIGGSAARGAVAGGATVSEGGGVNRTVISLSAVAFALADAAGVVAYVGKKLYDFPEGLVVILSAVANLTITKSSAGVNADFDGDFGVGTVTASNNATLSSTEQDIIPTTATPQASAGATTAKGQSTGVVLLDGTGTAKDLYLNLLVDDADHDVTGTPCNLLVSGTITLHWIAGGDY